MWDFTGPRARLCEGWSRREILRVGGLGVFGGQLALGQLLGAAAATGPRARTGRAKSCILLFLGGGVDQHSTWDPKPDAPAEVRGPFGTIDTAIPGVRFGELMAKTARVADRLCVLRAVSTGDNAHSSSGYYLLTGRPHQPMNIENAPPGAPNDAPCLGGLIGHLKPGAHGLPGGVTLPQPIANTGGFPWPGQDAGFLGRTADPWLLNMAMEPGGAKVLEVELPDGLGPERIGHRRDLLDQVARQFDRFADDSAANLDAQRLRAYEVLASAEARRAFRLDLETPETRELYGDTPFGRSTLLARRLVEAGVGLIQVNWYRGQDEPPANPVWDSHVDEPNRLKNVLVPPADQAIAGLILDLERRGLLDETLVVCLSEFGRSPTLDAQAGRGHWGSVFSIALAGGGVRGGMVYGASDKLAAQPKDGRVPPEDLVATILHCLGIAPEVEIRDRVGRPTPASRGVVLSPVLA